MNTRALRILQVLLGLIAAAHVAIGAGLNLASSGMVETMASNYGAEVGAWSAQMLYIVKPLGAFMLVLGLLAAPAAWNPRKYRVVIYAFVLLFLTRALQRVMFSQEIIDTFGIAEWRNLSNAAFFAGLAVVLVVLDWLAAGPGPSESA